MTHEARIEELERELEEAKRTIEELRRLQGENVALRERVADLQQELVTLSPPRIPKIDGSLPGTSDLPAVKMARARRSRLLTWTTLILVLAGALIATAPYVMSWVDRSGSDVEYTEERGLRLPE